MGLENRVVLDRYRVLWRLEHKNLVKTYLARDEESEAPGTPVIIKQYLHDLGDPRRPAYSAFYDELEALSELRHPGVVTTLDYGTVDGTFLIAFEYVRGATLSEICQHFERQEKPFPPRFAVYVVRRILADLIDCKVGPNKSLPLVHGRITVNAVHVQCDGRPKLADFGLATLEDVACEAESQLGFFRTRMSYAAPEITRGEAPSPAGDAYSVALLLYRLLTGQNPFRGQSIPETVSLVMQHRPGGLKLADWPLNERASAVLLKALDKDPAQRYAGPKELLSALNELSTEPDELVAADLAKIVEVNVTADWEQVARLTRAVGLSRRPRGSHALAHLVDSHSPAFVSGLVTQQPAFGTDHAMEELTRVKSRRRRSRGFRAIATVVLPAAAITLGLFLGRLSWKASSAAAAPESPTPSGALAEPKGGAALASLRAALAACVREAGQNVSGATVELDYGQSGQLEAVRLLPAELAETRVGACLLRAAWERSSVGGGRLSVVIPLDAAEHGRGAPR